MTAYGIIGDREASPKLVRAALSDLLEAHQRVTPEGDFWIKVGVRDGETKVHDEIIDWAARNEVYFEVVTPAANYQPYLVPAQLTVSPSFMLDVVETMHREDGGKILALVGDQTPRTDVLRALAKAKDNGTEIRDLAEAGLTLILFKGDDPPSDTPEENDMAAEEEELTLAELGEISDDPEHADAEEAQTILIDSAAEVGLDPDEYPTWAELATALQTLAGEDEEEETEEEPDPVIEGLTREELVGKEISEIKQLAKAAGIEGYSKMRREPLINALLGVEPEPVAAATAPARKTTGAAKKAAPSADDNGDVGLGGAGLTEADVERIAGAVVSKLAAVLSTG